MFKDHHTGPQKALFGAEAPVPEVFSPLNPELCTRPDVVRVRFVWGRVDGDSHRHGVRRIEGRNRFAQVGWASGGSG